MNCRFCKAAISFNFFNDDELRRLQLCFTCCFWWEKVEMRANGDLHEGNRVARIKNNHFIVYPDDYSGFAGFGGRSHTIKFDNGDVVVTKNLWHQGEIPKRFRGHLPNNATFVDTRLTCSCRNRTKFEPLTPNQTRCMDCVRGLKPKRW